MTSENLRAAGWTVAAYGSVAINDALIKLVMLRMPQLQAIFVRGFFVVPLLSTLALCRHELCLPIAKRERALILIRCVADISATFAFLAAIHRGPMADVAVILGAQPLCVMLGASSCLGDRIDKASWGLGAIGLLGVVLVSRPSPRTGLSASALLAIAANLLGVWRDLMSRRISAAVPSTQIATISAFMVVLTAGVVGPFVGGWTTPSPRELGLLLIASIFLTSAQLSRASKRKIHTDGLSHAGCIHSLWTQLRLWESSRRCAWATSDSSSPSATPSSYGQRCSVSSSLAIGPTIGR